MERGRCRGIQEERKKQCTEEGGREREKTKKDDKSKERESPRAHTPALSAVQLRSGPLFGTTTLCYIVILVIDHRFVAL
ncbi:hypothetical protein PBY51_012346 [Eleginops maclovinus]|uniref:Uncharacterized protein n=1 Tax=Eleginops maclovinus TaxID=56733 RepID=A0AAN7XT40_ELEMC|nr:hypothetical protein PBY51_012346 [Eleginops maclovinus]